MFFWKGQENYAFAKLLKTCAQVINVFKTKCDQA